MNPVEFLRKNPKMRYVLFGALFLVLIGLSYSGLVAKKAAEAPAAVEAEAK